MVRAKSKDVVANDAPVPAGTRYSGIVDELKTEIASGEYPLGAKLPTEFELCTRFGVSRSTVRQALAELESAGLVVRRQGSGTTVVAREPVLRYSLTVASVADVSRYGSETFFDILEFASKVNEVDSRRLQLGAPTEWRLWRGVRRPAVGGLPIGLISAYVPTVYLPSMAGLGTPRREPIFEHIARANGLVVTGIEQRITATVISAEESELLRTPAGTPALAITRRFLSSGGLIEVSEGIHPSDRFSYEILLALDDSS